MQREALMYCHTKLFEAFISNNALLAYRPWWVGIGAERKVRVVSFAFPVCSEQEDFLSCLPQCLTVCLLLKFAPGPSSGVTTKIPCPTPLWCLTTGMYLGAETLGCPNMYCRRQHSETASLNTHWSDSPANQGKLFPLTNELTLWHWSIWCSGDHTGVKVWERHCCFGTLPNRSRVHTL